MSAYDNELKRMQSLIGYGMNESQDRKNGNAVLEYHSVAADGKTYGIIRECNKFYIKVAPNKDTEVLAEDYNYIGGEMNKKANEYSSYALASKNFELKMMSINESCKSSQPVVTNQVAPSEWQVNETKEMRREIDRYNQIVSNVDTILTEGSNGFTVAHTLPEAPAKNPSDKEVNSPFTDTAVAEGDKDFKKEATDPMKQGAPFNQDGKATDKDMKSDKNHTGMGDTVYSEKAKYVPEDAIANKSNKGGKAVKMNEGRTIKLTEEQVLAWNKSKDFMDMTKGTEIGSTAPYVEGEGGNGETDGINESEGIAVHNTDDENKPKVGTSETGDDAPYTEQPVNEMQIDSDDVAGMEGESDDNDEVPFPDVEDDGGAYLGFEDEFNDWLDKQETKSPEITLDLDDDDDFDSEGVDLDFDELEGGDEEEDDDYYNDNFGYDRADESRRRRMNESELNVFGKHPAWRKQAMTTPPNVETSKSGRDWNDKSAKGNAPYAQSKGDSAPFTEDVVDMITDAIINHMSKKKV